MTTEMKTTMDRRYTASKPATARPILNSALKVGRFLLHLLEMLLAMTAGMIALSMLEDLIPASSSYAAIFASGSPLYALAMGVFMTVPMVAWMILRGHGWRHGGEMAFAMLAPMAGIVAMSRMSAGTPPPWLDHASHLMPLLGMVTAMLYRRDHYTGKAGHSNHK